MVSTNLINRNHIQLLPFLQKQKNTDISYYNNGDEEVEQENKSSDDEGDDKGDDDNHGRKINIEEDDIKNYDTDDNENNNNNKNHQQKTKKQRVAVEHDHGCHTYSGGSKGQGSKSGSCISFKKARLVGMDEIHSNRMVSTATCHQEEVSESITMSTAATMRKDAYVEWRNAQGQMVSFSTVERSVRKYARDTLFSKVKFITLDSQLEYTGKCVRHCN